MNRFLVEMLEDRVVPTILFTPQYGAEPTTNNHGWEISNPTVQLVYWGSSWTASQESTVTAYVSTLINGGYFSGLSQYVGRPGARQPRIQARAHYLAGRSGQRLRFDPGERHLSGVEDHR